MYASILEGTFTSLLQKIILLLVFNTVHYFYCSLAKLMLKKYKVKVKVKVKVRVLSLDP